MSDDTFEYITTDYMVSIDTNEPPVVNVEYIVELGEQGVPGIQGEKGEEGFSPTVGYTLNNGELKFVITNEDGIITTPNVFDYVMNKDGSNALNPVTINHLTMGYQYGSPYIDSDNNLYLKGVNIGLQTTGDINLTPTGTGKAKYNNKEIATVNDISDATITLTQGGVTKGSFTLNGSATTIDLDAGGAGGLYTDGSNADADFTVNGVELAGNYVCIGGVSYGGIHTIQTNPNIYYQLGVNSNGAFLSMPALTLNSHPAISSGGMVLEPESTLNATGNLSINTYSGGKLLYNSYEVITKAQISDMATQTWVGNQGYITGITSGDVTTALGYTPLQSSDLANYVTTNTAQTISGSKTFSSETYHTGVITFNSGLLTPIIRSVSGSSYRNMIYRMGNNSAIIVGNSNDTIDLKGSGTRPTYNSNDLALYSDIPSSSSFANTDLSNLSTDGEARLHALKGYKDEGELLTDTEGLNDIISERNTGFDITKFTKVGSPTITDNGIASNFGNGSYYKISNISTGSYAWEFYGKFIFGGNTGNQQALTAGLSNASAPLLYLSGNQMQLHIPSTGGSWLVQLQNASHTFTIGNTYYFKVGWDLTNYYIKVSDDNGETWTTLQTASGSAMLGGSGTFDLAFGSNPTYNNRYVSGSIDLKEFSITVNGVSVFSPLANSSSSYSGTDAYSINGTAVSIPYVLSKTGSKIVDSAYRTDVASVYSAFGYAPYYTLNETSSDFTLPQGEVYGIINKVSETRTPDYKNAITIASGATLLSNGYTAPADGYIIAHAFTTGGTYIGYINGVQVIVIGTTPDTVNISQMVPIVKGDMYYDTMSGTLSGGTRYFVPIKEI